MSRTSCHEGFPYLKRLGYQKIASRWCVEYILSDLRREPAPLLRSGFLEHTALKRGQERRRQMEMGVRNPASGARQDASAYPTPQGLLRK
jgi:hypothetical protein